MKIDKFLSMFAPEERDKLIDSHIRRLYQHHKVQALDDFILEKLEESIERKIFYHFKRKIEKLNLDIPSLGEDLSLLSAVMGERASNEFELVMGDWDEDEKNLIQDDLLELKTAENYLAISISLSIKSAIAKKKGDIETANRLAREAQEAKLTSEQILAARPIGS